MRERAALHQMFEELGLPIEWLCERVPFAQATTLVRVIHDSNDREVLLAPVAAAAWRELNAAARVAGLRLQLISGFRSYERQVFLWQRKLRAGLAPEEIRCVLALPGFSQHHTGRAVDVGTPDCCDLTEGFEQTAEFRWLTNEAARFGFSMPYARGNSHGIAYEPWHWWFDRA